MKLSEIIVEPIASTVSNEMGKNELATKHYVEGDSQELFQKFVEFIKKQGE